MKELITLALMWVCVPGMYVAMFLFALLIIARAARGAENLCEGRYLGGGDRTRDIHHC
jgi:hypothetical protein